MPSCEESSKHPYTLVCLSPEMPGVRWTCEFQAENDDAAVEAATHYLRHYSASFKSGRVFAPFPNRRQLATLHLSDEVAVYRLP